MSRRTDRVNALLRQELSDLLRDEIRDPRVSGIVSITHVDVSPDLAKARAYVSVLGSDAERAATMSALESARPFVRRELGRRLHMRNAPDVTFISDRGMEEAQELTDKMRRNAEQRGESL